MQSVAAVLDPIVGEEGGRREWRVQPSQSSMRHRIDSCACCPLNSCPGTPDATIGTFPGGSTRAIFPLDPVQENASRTHTSRGFMTRAHEAPTGPSPAHGQSWRKVAGQVAARVIPAGGAPKADAFFEAA